MSLNLVSLNHKLIQNFVDSLIPEESTYNESLDYFNRIKNALLANSQYDISHVNLSGSLKKGTALRYYFDMDIIVFYNCTGGYQTYLNIRSDLLNEIESILVEEFQCEYLSNIKTLPKSFKININNLHVDILTGLNRLQADETNLDIQYNRILNQIHYKSGDSPVEASYEMQTSMAPKSDQFVLDQSNFVFNVIMMCKHWCRSNLTKETNFHGRSSAMELVAIHVGNSVEEENYSQAFYMFLEKWIYWENMNIEFQYSPKFRNHLISREKPYLLDPVNPYNNRIGKVSEDKLQNIKNIAKMSLKAFIKCFKYTEQFDDFFQFSYNMGYTYYADCDIFEEEEDYEDEDEEYDDGEEEYDEEGEDYEDGCEEYDDGEEDYDEEEEEYEDEGEEYYGYEEEEEYEDDCAEYDDGEEDYDEEEEEYYGYEEEEEYEDEGEEYGEEEYYGYEEEEYEYEGEVAYYDCDEVQDYYHDYYYV